ncbi:helix-turn-helix domain-containing protein [Embleya sp. NPDC127516]|uniref:helix-turn-helix domain-containing protein n=1 Tax=Embleya sp. NPDC127516 TaxID=3363990 RepID=UPI00381202E7
MRRHDQDDALVAYARWVYDRAVERGYDLDSPRGGGRSQLAADAGMSASSVGRLLKAETMPDLDSMIRLAKVLNVEVREMLIRSGKLTEEDLPLTPRHPTATQVSSDDQILTPEEAVTRVGVKDARVREMAAWMLRKQLNEESVPGGQGDLLGGDAEG